MTLSLDDCTFSGPALPEPFVRLELEHYLQKAGLLPPMSGRDGKAVAERWETMRRKLRLLGEQGGPTRVANHVLEPLRERLGYTSLERCDPVSTREGDEDGGWLLLAEGNTLRAWAFDFGTDLDAPSRRGRAYRFSPARIADRVLRARNERLALLTDGQELRVMICDPAQRESQLIVRLDRAGGWQSAKSVPDSYRLVLALAAPKGLAGLAELTEKARLSQVQVTKDLRQQAKRAVTEFVQGLLDDRENAAKLAAVARGELPSILWREALIVVYRLLFILKLESSPDLTQAFSFASNSLWRNTYSPNTALGAIVRDLQKCSGHTGSLLADGLRAVFRLFEKGLQSSGLQVTPLDGMLFGPATTRLIESLTWSEYAVGRLLDNLLWTAPSGIEERRRVQYGTLDVEDLGRIYEALLELEPGIANEPMCRIRRQKLEIVLPKKKGERYRLPQAVVNEDDIDEPADDDDDDVESKQRKAKVVWIEDVRENQFFLRAGLGRKSTGAYYTPPAFVRFLVQETLRPHVEEQCPRDNPMPHKILALKVLDPAMGSGHFLVEACRFLADRLYEACRVCDEKAEVEEAHAAQSKSPAARERHLKRASEFRQRLEQLPDPNNELVAFLPSRALEGATGGFSEVRARGLCRRLVAVHCLYGVDRNPLAVELAKVSLWIESQAEGLPLTFFDHRLLCGDSLTGPFLEQLLTFPSSKQSLEEDQRRSVLDKLDRALKEALAHVKELESSVGKNIAEIETKRAAKNRLDVTLAPFKRLASAWSAGVCSPNGDDAAYTRLVCSVGADVMPEHASGAAGAQKAASTTACVPYDLEFPEVFYPQGLVEKRAGFDVVLGNPPWDAIRFNTKEFLAAFDLEILEAPTKREREATERRLLADPQVESLFREYQNRFEEEKRSNDRLYTFQKLMIDGDLAGRQLDSFRVFLERKAQLLKERGTVGAVVPSAFHANAGAAGVRRLYLEQMTLQFCFSFENRRKLFDIDSRFKFALIAARKFQSPARGFKCAFYLHDQEWLFCPVEALEYDPALIRRLGGAHLSFPELRDATAVAIASRMAANGMSFHEAAKLAHVTLQQTPATLHSSKEARRLQPAPARQDGDFRSDPTGIVAQRGFLVVHEGKTFRDYTACGAHGRRGSRADARGPEDRLLCDSRGRNPWCSPHRSLHPRFARRAAALARRGSGWHAEGQAAMSIRRRRWTDSAGIKHETWLVDVQVVDRSGRVRRVQRVSPVNNRRAAEKFEHELRESLLNSSDEGPSSPSQSVPTFAEFAARFMATYAATNNKASEVEAKNSILRVYLLQAFGTCTLDRIGVAEVEEYKARKLESKMARKTINNQLTVLRKMLATAVEWGVIRSVPRVRWLKTPTPQFDFLTFEEASRLIAAAPSDWRAPITIALRAGLRQGELRALRWSDVDLERGRIVVRRAVWRDIVSTPKNGRVREVPLSQQAAEALQEHSRLGEMVFCTPGGSMLSKGAMKWPLWNA